MPRISSFSFLRYALILPILFYVGLVEAAYYSERPSILEVKAKNNFGKGLSQAWQRSQYGHFVFLAQLLTFFPDDEYYFLARDIEYGFDMATVLLRTNPILSKRLHLVPISSNINNEDEMVDYLEQEGLTKKNLKSRDAVFIDSCCTGTIPTSVETAFEDKPFDIRGYLIQTDEYPRSQLAETLGADGEEIESLPHFTESATKYVEVNDKIEIRAPLSPPAMRENSLKIMQQIRLDYDNIKARNRFGELVDLMRTAYSYFAKQSPYKKASQKAAEAALHQLSEKFKIPVTVFLQDIESMSRKDYVTISKTNYNYVTSDKSKAVHADLNLVARRLLMEPQDPADIEEHYSGHYEHIGFDEILGRAMVILDTSSPKELDITADEYDKLVKQWLSYAGPLSDHMGDSEEGQTALMNLKLKSNKGMAALRDFVDGHGKLNSSELKTAKDVVRKSMVAAGYVYDNSAMKYLVRENSFLHWNPELYRFIVTDFVEHAKTTELVKATEDILKTFSNWWIESGYDDAKVGLYIEVLKIAINGLPTIGDSLTKALLKSQFLKSINEDTSFKPFVRWFFAQKEHFEPAAKKRVVSRSVASDLTSGKLKSDQQLTVADLLNYFSPKGTTCSKLLKKK